MSAGHLHTPSRFLPDIPAVKWLRLIIVAAGLTFLAGLFTAPQRAWGSYLVGAYMTLGFGLAGAIFVSAHYLSGAGWGVVIRRIPENMASLIPVGGLLMVGSLLGIRQLYPWTHLEIVAESPVLAGKIAYLNIPFFILRMGFFLVVWSLLARAINRHSLVQDHDKALEHTIINRKLSAIFLLILGPTFTLAAVDWILSLQPEFYSTIFAIYLLCGLALSGTAAITLIAIFLRRLNYLPQLRDDHLHDLGKLMLTFSTLWAYMWLSQYLMIWYANIPEEIVFYLSRTEGIWGPLWLINLVLNWGIPFILLLPRWSKRREKVLLIACVVVLLGQWLDVSHLVMPVLQDRPVIGLIEIIVPLGGLALFTLLLLNRFSVATIIPVGDPFLQESMDHHQ